ncbi:MAG: hypothetical protein ACP5JR_02425, partial [Thermoplasmata archaeon]
MAYTWIPQATTTFTYNNCSANECSISLACSSNNNITNNNCSANSYSGIYL